MSDRQKVFVALLASALLHLVGALVFGLLWETNQHALIASVPPPKPLEVTLITRPLPEKKIEPRPEKPEIKPLPDRLQPVAEATPPPEPPAAKPKPLRPVSDSEGLVESPVAPTHPAFSSDKNSVAGNEVAGTGDGQLPGQTGKERPFTFFENKDYSAGKLDAPPGPKGRPEMAVRDLPKLPPVPQPTTVVQPTPAPLPPLFKPEPLPMSTPTPPPNPDALRIVKAAPTPQPTPFELPKPKPLENAPVLPTPIPTPRKLALLATPRAVKSGRSEAGFQSQKEAPKIDGGPVIKGLKGVDSVSTPLGRYRKSLASAISQRWNEHIREHMDLITLGTVRIRFYVTASGRAEEIRLLSNSSTEAFATYTIKSIMEAKIPPLPEDVVPLLENGRLEITEWSFTIYPE